jgi:aldehyde:ferredoxin oxidoreductase
MTMANGYAGKILKIDLTSKKIEEIPTSKYEDWGGGHGMGSAVFWDLCEDKTVAGTDPKNVVTIMASPLSGTLASGAAGRTEVQGIGLQGWPVGWFTRSNFGGRFSTQLKYAGWDGIAILGKSETQVWLNIVDGKVTLEDATSLWGLDTYETQKKIWASVLGSDQGDWSAFGGSRDSGRSTQRPAVLSSGPNAEKFGPMAALVHDGGNGAGQGGFGGVFASKNLKAVSVLGTGGIEVADPNALMEARTWLMGYALAGNWDNPSKVTGNWPLPANPGTASSFPAGTATRPQGCAGCVRMCRCRTGNAIGNDSMCIDFWQSTAGVAKSDVSVQTCDAAQKAGINMWPLLALPEWLGALYKEGVLGKGKQIESSLDYDQMGSLAFGEGLINAIVTQTDIGADLALGLWQCAKKWGRLEKDLASGTLSLQEWGYVHHYDGRTEAEWGYGSLIGERDINEHDFNWICYWTVTIWAAYGMTPLVTAERMAEIIGKKMVPYADDPKLIDYSDEGIYAESMAKTVAWHRHYTRYYKQALGFCDWNWADFVNPYGPDNVGATGEGEPKFFNAVTGKSQTFEEGMEIGRKIWNLDRAVWVLQGRTRDMEVYSDYMYDKTANEHVGIAFEMPYTMPVFENGAWSYKNVNYRKLDRAKVEDWKTKFYTLEGWDTKTGAPTRKTLEDLGLKDVADKLEAAGKLGAA